MVATGYRKLALAALTFLLGIAPGTATADDVSRQELDTRIQQAMNGDDGPLSRVTSVDGAAVDLTITGSSDERRTQLQTLQRALEDEEVELDGGDLRTEAEAIVSKPPYSAAVAQDSGLLARFVDLVARFLANDAAQGLALVVVAVIALVIAIPLLNRRVSRRSSETDQATAEATPRDFAAEAEAAATRGEFAAAVRMLFLDGAEHLERQRVVPDASTVSAATVRRVSGRENFLDRFDEITYGGSAANADDVSMSRTGWQRVKERWSK